MKPALIAFLAAALAAPVLAQEAGAAGPIAIHRAEAQARGLLAVASPAFVAGGLMALKYSGYGEDVSPALSWTAAPGAKSYVVICEDPDVRRPTPLVHWLVWNIPAGVTGLPEAVPKPAWAAAPKGLVQGANGHGSMGYSGPHPPAGATHHYDFQVLALDRTLDLPADADVAALLAAARGHVLAAGELVGTFQGITPPKG